MGKELTAAGSSEGKRGRALIGQFLDKHPGQGANLSTTITRRKNFYRA